MLTITVRNVHEALPHGIHLLDDAGLHRDSRTGEVLVAPWPVITEYLQPAERLTFWPERDVNVAFLVYEALWMLAGREDLTPLTRYIKDFGRYSDDGHLLHGAYGYRWRHAFHSKFFDSYGYQIDQLAIIAEQLRTDQTDRRCVLAMWDVEQDLGYSGKDAPCNLMATFQRDSYGRLDLTVFCRSNDIIWGAYFANAFHFSLLQEYMARWIGCAVGVYRQMSVNYHGYLDTLTPLLNIPKRAFDHLYSVPAPMDDPYRDGRVRATELPCGPIDEIDEQITNLLYEADNAHWPAPDGTYAESEFYHAARAVLHSHHLWRTRAGLPGRFEEAMRVLPAESMLDIIEAQRLWLGRRQTNLLALQQKETR